MADSDSVESSMSGAEFDIRVRGVGKDMVSRMSTDKHTPNKSKSSSSSADAPQIGASYLVRRQDDARRKLQSGYLAINCSVSVNTLLTSYGLYYDYG